MNHAAIELRAVRKNFGPAEIIRGVDLAVPKGERHAIIGPNGAGKSTLFNLISGAFPPTAGEIHVNGRRIDGKPPYKINRAGLSRSFQVTNIFHNMSVYENIRAGVLWSLGHRYVFWRTIDSLGDVTRRADEILDLIRLGAERDRPAGRLPYADQRALELRDTIPA